MWNGRRRIHLYASCDERRIAVQPGVLVFRGVGLAVYLTRCTLLRVEYSQKRYRRCESRNLEPLLPINNLRVCVTCGRFSCERGRVLQLLCLSHRWRQPFSGVRRRKPCTLARAGQDCNDYRSSILIRYSI